MAELADALDSGSNRGNSVEVQVLLSAPRKTSTQCVLVFLFRCGRGLEQHGPTAGGATKAPVGLLLVRGSQPIGMSTGRTAANFASPSNSPFVVTADNMDTGCVELLLRDGRMISIDCTGVEDALDVTMAQQTELDYLIYNDPLAYADLILNGDTKEYLKNVAGSHGLED